ncbi:MAG: iron chelate uptake ABC transporter family permease subunit [Planctomycetota bacterium]|nr:iron chelate uptake ABC transporter family permease subunit [Planctomycetota bacterium]
MRGILPPLPTAAPSIGDFTDELPAWAEIVDTLTFQRGFNTSLVVFGTTLLGIAAGLVGVFALLRKRSLMSDALSHATLPGIGAAFILAASLGFEGRSLPLLLAGAAATGVLGVLCVQLLLRHTRLREDASIGIVLSVFFGAGVVLLSVIQGMSTGDAAGLNTFIYGQTAAMQRFDAMLMMSLAVLAVLCALLLLKEFAIVCFNDSFAKVMGWPVSVIDLLIMALVTLVTVAGLQAVGIILVVAMLIVPAVAARFWTNRLWLLALLGGVIGGASGYFGSVISALLPRKPAGAVIVLTAGAIFLFSMLAAPKRGVLANAIRRLRLRLRIARDHLLESMHERGAAADGAAHSFTLREMARERGWSRWRTALMSAGLRLHGFIRAESRGYALTEKGRAAGARIARNHALWEQYLISYADIAPSHVDWSVDHVEHVLSEELVAELEAALRRRGVGMTGPMV